MSTTQAVILARGLGTRMRRELVDNATEERPSAATPEATPPALPKPEEDRDAEREPENAE